MFFNLHPKSIIGYKKLSNSDLGLSSGKQTHIGLFENTLNFLTCHTQVSTSQLIYKDIVIETESFLDYIQNTDGSFRSPKIRSSTKGTQSTVRKIREISSSNKNISWYLMWFGVENEDLTFLLIEENSLDYNYLINILPNLKKGTIEQNSAEFLTIINFLNTKVNSVNFNYLQELELFTQTNEQSIIKKKNPKRYDIIKAQKLFQEIGRKGEEFVNEHLLEQKFNREIKDFEWVNKNSESGYPFDFEIIDNSGSIIYSDSKATSYKFEQKMIFSSQELTFINQNENYMIHRVFDLNNTPQLKTCHNIYDITNSFIKNYETFNGLIEKEDITLRSMKLAISPNHKKLHFEDIQINN